MPTYKDQYTERFYIDDSKEFDVTVEIEGAATRRDRRMDTVRTVDRIRAAVREETQAIQDEIDVNGEVSAVDER